MLRRPVSDEPETDAEEAAEEAEAETEEAEAENEEEAEPQAEEADPETEESGPLAEARAAFDAGDFKRVRGLSAKLADSDDPETARAALELRRKTAIDPAQVAVLVMCLGFFLWICSKYVF